MKSIYKITRGQLVTMWIFGIIGFFVGIAQAEYSSFASFMAVLIPAFLIFYTIGWKSFNKSTVVSQTEKVEFVRHSKKVFSKKVIISLIVIIILGIIVSFCYEKISERQYSEKSRAEYVGAFGKYDNYLELTKKCLVEKVEAYKERYTLECKQRYDEAYANYQDCKKDMYWKSHNQCINWGSSNYEAIDCSEKTIQNTIITTYDTVCTGDLVRESEIITDYEKRIVSDYLDSIPKTQSAINSSEMKKLYNLFPQNVFDEKTKVRINKIVTGSGYKINQE